MAINEKVAIIVPAHNEQWNIGRLARDLGEIIKRGKMIGVDPETKEKIFLEIKNLIVVDDGSIDHTASIAERNGAEVLRLEKNFGKSFAFYRGAKRAKDLGATILVTLDADLKFVSRSQLLDLIEPVLFKRAQMGIGTVVDDSPFVSGQRAIRMSVLEPLFRQNKKWETYFGMHKGRPVFRMGYGLENALNELIRKQVRAFTDFKTTRSAYSKTRPVAMDKETMLPIKLARKRQKKARFLWKTSRDRAFAKSYLQILRKQRARQK